MKVLLSMVAILGCLSATAHAQSQELDVLRGNNLESQQEKGGTSAVAVIEQQITESVRQKCRPSTGCTLFANDASGNEFQIGGNAGVGNGLNNGYGYGGGIAIIDPYGRNNQNNDLYYGLTITYTHTNTVCKAKVDEAVFRYIQGYIGWMSTPEYIANVMKRQEQGEVTTMSEEAKMAFATLATLKPTQSECNIFQNRGR
ncbi:MAG: hypothetical protein EOP06_02100 [Proteobacteria bacterium]|nr:MAG: hypothetical protein EOP06_02100 [Pseudomonadota bacterium]